MTKIKWLFIASMIIMLLAMPLFAACPGEETTPPPEYTLYVGGGMSLTGAYAEDSAAVLAAIEDYVQYVNETKMMAPWRSETFPDNVTLEVLWRDDELNVEKALTIYEELKAKGMLVYRTSGSSTALALMDRLNEDRMGSPSALVSGPYLLSPPKTCLTIYPIYTDDLAAIADWFLENWTEDRAPRVAYLTADYPPGKSILIPEMDAYLESIGYELVGTQLVPLVPTSPPTTQLLWLKENKVDLALCWMINPGSQPTIKEAVRLGMGTNLDYKITFGLAAPSHLPVFVPAMGAELSEGVVVAGSYPPLDDLATPGVAFCNDLQEMYHPNDMVTHVMYEAGLVEAMVQVEALRLAMLEMPVEDLTPVDVLDFGFFKITDLDTGGLSSTPLSYSSGNVEGVDEVRVDQALNGKIVKQGTWPLRHLYAQ
ncbi:MAG: ABC transporter substrate-binding protein [Deltaproteobacteria bacterium]|nr:ABC transporter substrate-binding protein [Deltaproteobacteria bacterium]